MAIKVAPCWAIRTAGLPFNIVDRRIFDRSLELLEEFEDAERNIGRTGDALANCLYDVRRRISGNATISRDILKLRRDAHNKRMPPGPFDTTLVRVRSVLSPTERQLLDDWIAAFEDLARAEAAFLEEIEIAVGAAREAYMDAISSSEILRGIAIASPTLCLALINDKGVARPAKQRRFERSVVSYVNRISRKISPFSTLTTVTTQSNEGTARTNGVGSVHIAHAFEQTILDTVATYVENSAVLLRGPVYFASSPLTEAFARILLPLRSAFDDFFYAEDVSYDLPRALKGILDEENLHTVSEWLERLGCSRWVLAELIAEGVLVPSCSLSDVVRHRSRKIACEKAFLAIGSILEAESFIPDPRPEVRAKAILQFRERAKKFVSEHEGVAPSWMSTAPLVHEICPTQPELVPPISEKALCASMNDVANIIRPTVMRSAFYDSLLSAFTKFSGATGRIGLVDFVTSCISSPSVIPITTRAIERDFTRVEHTRLHGVDEEICFDGIGTLAPATFTAFLQPLGGETEEWSMAVLNRVNQGPGGLLVRWGSIPGCNDQLADNYTSWLKDLHPGSLVAAVTTGDSWAGVQRIPNGVVPRLLWPTSACILERDQDDILATDLDVIFDAATGTLQVVLRRTGQPVALPYLGVIPQHLLRGSGKILQVLTDPWIYDFRVGLEAANTLSKATRSIEFRPRKVSGSIVVRRSSWRVATETMPLVNDAKNPGFGRLLIYFERWRARNNIARRVYVKAGDSSNATLRRSKPQFVDFADPFTLDLLLKLAREVPFIILEEALPDESPWWPIKEQPPYSMEITAVMSLGDGRSL